MSRRFDLVHRVRHGHEVVRSFDHAHPFHEVTFVEAGELAFDLGTHEVRGTSGSALALPPGVRSTPVMRTVTMRQLHLPGALLDDAARACGGRAPTTATHFGADGKVSVLLKAFFLDGAQTRGDEDPGQRALVDALALALVAPAHVRSPAPRARPEILRVLETMRETPGASHSVDSLAALAGLPRFTFMRAFRAQVGQSPWQHLVGLRLERAAARLRTSDATVLDVALEVGFDDPSRFARAFARRFGLTPSRWRHESPR